MSKTYASLSGYLLPVVLLAAFFLAISDAADPLIREYYVDERGTPRGGKRRLGNQPPTRTEAVKPIPLTDHGTDREPRLRSARDRERLPPLPIR